MKKNFFIVDARALELAAVMGVDSNQLEGIRRSFKRYFCDLPPSFALDDCASQLTMASPFPTIDT